MFRDTQIAPLHSHLSSPTVGACRTPRIRARHRAASVYDPYPPYRQRGTGSSVGGSAILN